MPPLLKNVRRFLSRFSKRDAGNVAITFALCLLPILGAVGAGIDYARAIATRTQMQATLDSAVLGGVKQSSASAQIAAASNLFGAEAATFSYANPTATFSVTGGGHLSGSAQGAAPTYFLGLFSMKTIPIGVTSAAVASGTAYNVCILLVDGTAAQSFLVNSGAKLNAPACEIDVLSTASPAAIINSGTTLNVSRICVKGSNVIGGATPPLEVNCSTITDPFAGALPAVSPGACTFNNQVYNPGSVTINPGVYCGATNFNGSGTLTLNPGLYIVKNGSMTFNPAWSVTGSGVTFYLANANSSLQFNGGVDTNISAPTSGTYANILMFEPVGLAQSNLAIDGTSGSNLSGLIYLPSRAATINSISNVSANKVTMVFSTLILDQMNWSISEGVLGMTNTGGSGEPRLTN
jgi:Flp pilus assembly protein TadG